MYLRFRQSLSFGKMENRCSNELIIANIQTGSLSMVSLNKDIGLIEYFFNRKCSGLFRYILINVFDGNVDKQDLFQELFWYVDKNNWHKVRQFDFRSKLMTWLTVVAVRLFQKKREELIEKSTSITLNDKMWQEQSCVISFNQRMDLHNTLAKMPNAHYRKVIEVSDLQEVHPEILAEVMNVIVENMYLFDINFN